MANNMHQIKKYLFNMYSDCCDRCQGFLSCGGDHLVQWRIQTDERPNLDRRGTISTMVAGGGGGGENKQSSTSSIKEIISVIH